MERKDTKSNFTQPTNGHIKWGKNEKQTKSQILTHRNILPVWGVGSRKNKWKRKAHKITILINTTAH
jgi:hypothetical protein